MRNQMGERLRELRALRKVTQDDVADMLNVKRQTYSAYERGVSVPDAITIKKLANFFGVTTDYIIDLQNGRDDTAEKGFADYASGHGKLTDQEMEYIRMYRKATPEFQAAALALLEAAEKARLARGSSGEDI